jgi:predicted secreted acid phosphatase
MTVQSIVRAAVLASAIALAGCAHAPPTPPPPPKLYEVKRRLAEYVSSRRYEADLAAVAAEAAADLERRAKEGGRLAIVFDVDETLLSNIRWLELNDWGVIMKGATNFVSGPCGLLEWVQVARSRPIEPTLALARRARELGVAVFLITSRPESTREATEKNLRAAGCEWSGLTLKPPGLKVHSEAEYKAPARERITREGYRILFNVGDQESDLAGGFAERTFKLPNPFYFTP